MVAASCPKCGSPVADTAVICARCDFILDLSFLDTDNGDENLFGDDETGADFLTVDADAGRVEQLAPHKDDPTTDLSIDVPAVPLIHDGILESEPSPFDEGGAYGGHAIILGNLEGGRDFESMLSDATASVPLAGVARVFQPAAVYVGGDVQAMCAPDAVIAARPEANRVGLQLSPFEEHVLSFIDGKRPVARIGKKARLSAGDLKIAIGMLADRNLIVVVGNIKPDIPNFLDANDLDDSAEHELAVQAPPPPTARPEVPAAISVPRPSGVRSGAPTDNSARGKAAQMLELGLADLRTGKRARALTYVKMAAELDPDNEKARSLLGNWANASKVAASEAEDQVLVAEAQRAEEEGRFDVAVELYRKAIKLKPNEAELQNRIGIIYALRMKDFTAATNALMKACELAPENVAYRSNLGKVFKFAEGAAPTALHKGSESDALRDAARAAKKPAGILSKLRKR